MKTSPCQKIAGLAALLVASSVSVWAASTPPPPLTLTAQQDHRLMMIKTGVESVRPGASGTNGLPNSANYDETKAIAQTPIRDPLTMLDGRKITTADQWWSLRRPEIAEVFDREFYGRMPEAAKNIKVTWTVTGTTQGMAGTTAIITRQLTGHVDNSSYPLIDVNITASVTTPTNATGKVPVIIVLSGGGGPAPAPAPGAAAAVDVPVPLTAEALKAAEPSLTDAQIAQVMQLGIPPAGAAAGARGGRGGAPAPLTIEGLKTALTLTDEQAAKITPILETMNKAQTAPAAGAQPAATAPTAAAEARTAGLAAIAAVLTEAQRPRFTALTTPPAFGRGGRGGAGGPSPWQLLALEHGWGYGSINTSSIQADNGAGLNKGIIGLINKGQLRKPDDWGSLRAWAWGFSKLMDFFETDSLVDVKQVGVEGHSRWGKATAATMANDPRVAIGYVSSSGEGGAKIWRHLVGEKVENLSGSGEYHWMAGNFIKYGGPKTVEDLPADAHELVALIAPRPVFVGGGNMGDAWQDPRGMFMAASLASPVYELLGKKGMESMTYPAVGVPLIKGDVAYRLHEQGHTDAPNWPTFIEFASRYLKSPGVKN